MAGKSLAMMPWFPRDFMAATRHFHLYERAVYRELLDHQWELGVLPDDEERLCRIVGLSRKEFAPLWAVVKDKFTAAEGGGLINVRLEEHRAKALAIREKREVIGRRGGKASIQAKRGATAKANTQPNAQANAQANGEAKPKQVLKQNGTLAEANFNHPSPSPSKDTPVGDEAVPVGTLKTQIYRLAKSIGISGGILTPEVERNGEEAVWEALGATVKAKPSNNIEYFKAILKPRERGFVC